MTTHEIPTAADPDTLAAVRTVIQHATTHRTHEFPPGRAFKAVAEARDMPSIEPLRSLPGMTDDVIRAYLTIRRPLNSDIFLALHAATDVYNRLRQSLGALSTFREPDAWIGLDLVRDVTDGIGPSTLDIMLRWMADVGLITLAAHDGPISERLDVAAIAWNGRSRHKLQFTA